MRFQGISALRSMRVTANPRKDSLESANSSKGARDAEAYWGGAGIEGQGWMVSKGKLNELKSYAISIALEGNGHCDSSHVPTFRYEVGRSTLKSSTIS